MASRWVSLFLGIALIQGIIAVSPIPLDEDGEWDSVAIPLNDPAYRLPTTTRPRHYEVTITPYFETVPTGVEPFTFDGEVRIYTSPQQTFINRTVIHCNDMTIHNLTVTYTDPVTGAVQDITAPGQDFTCVAPYSFLYIQTSINLLVNQEYVISATFRGNINNNMRGFYRSWYIDTSGVKRWMGTTQFQPGHARQAFPCYDEPSFKATFDITINREAGFNPTISNMPIRSTTTLDNGRISETFYTTPLTSTYLLAFIVSHYIEVETNNDNDRPFALYARDNILTSGEWAQEVGIQLLERMEIYTDIPYYDMAHNINMKQAAIPDFSAGAMENWGLLTYREALVLYDPQNSNHFYKQRVMNIVAHEITHMWLGNLVTCAWWDVLWLNEGFARFYTYFLADLVRPDLGFETRFIIEQVHTSMISDSIDSAHPLTDPSVNDPTSVSAHFSTITYARGASVIRMTEHFLGNFTFVKGMQNYMKERAFKVALPIHLFTALDEAAAEDSSLSNYNGVTIEEYFKTWSEQAGHPLLTVTVNQRTGQMIVTQHRWERNTGVSTIPSLYMVPITWTSAGEADFEDTKPSQVLTAQSTVIERGTTGNEWVIFNKQETGFYRVNYDDTNWALLTRALRSNQRTNIHERNRAQIVNDVFQLARAGVLRYERALNILSFLEFEDQYAPWLAAITGFNWVVRRLAHDEENLAKLREQILGLSVAVTARLGWAEIDNEDYMDGLLRMDLGTFLCNNGHPGCSAAAVTNFNNWISGGYVPPNMRPWVFCEGLRRGSAADFDIFWQKYLENDLSNDKIVMLETAGCTQDEASLQKYLSAIVAMDDSVRPQDYNTALNAAVTGNEVNTMRMFRWLTNNVAQVTAALGSIATPLRYVTARLLNEEQITEVQTWLDAQRTVIGDSAYNTGVNGIASARNFHAWSNTRVVELATYFETGYLEDNIDDIVDPAPEPEPVMTPQPVTTPDPDGEPDSANIAALSAVTLIVTLALNMVVQRSYSFYLVEVRSAAMLRCYLAFLCVLAVTAVSDTNYRLNSLVKPSSYIIAITPYFDTNDATAFTFDGEVSIMISTTTNTKQIKLHSEDLEFTASDITVTSGQFVLALDENNPLEFDKNYTFAYINMQNELQVGVDYKLKIVYTGPIRTDLNGFYRNYYIENGVDKWLGATQMEPTHARKVFPCFDEPEYKAIFTLVIDRPDNFKPSVANTHLADTVPLANGYTREIFHPSPKMSSYLVAFMVSEFEGRLTNDSQFGIYVRPEAMNQTDYAFDFGLRVVNALSDYLGIDYYSTNTYLKLDHVGLPDFEAGAMENWGLVNYRESLLLYVPEESTPYFKYRVAQIIAHETTHMWFGDLVTCHWWSNTWLNEGFADYFQDYITAIIEPDVGSADQLVTGSVYDGYNADESPTSPAITNNEVNSPAEIHGHFGKITYQKAGSIIRMVHHLIGDDAFKLGLQSYLKANQFEVGYPENLYSALHQEVTNANSFTNYPEFNIVDVMGQWIAKAGHPVLTVNIDYENETATLTQKRFYIDSSHQSNETYPIPITYTTELVKDFTNTKPVFIMNEESKELNLTGISETHPWVIFNVQETGFYRVNYDEHSWKLIANALKGNLREQIHHLNRAKIVNDLFAFVYADEVKFDQLFQVLEFLSDETDYSVWYAAIRGLSKLRASYLGSDAQEDIETYALKLLDGIINKLGYDVKATDSFVTLRNRMQVLEFACKLGHQGCIDKTVELFKNFKENGVEVSPSLRPVTYCNGLRHGDSDDYDFLYQRMKTTNLANEVWVIGYALGCSSDEDKLRSYLVSMLEEDSPIRTQDLTTPLASILSNYEHVHVVLEELKQNYMLWTTIYPSMDTILATVASALQKPYIY
ncbi:membrane alanyl aminopeptidase-like [Leguminivora glycinivorella]|uniref:membrane alanyl aminopeptidase-like n=2 Tax=Leguminivora glycinivorella TaxID=1035111 RepID=UPI00200C2A59|nr:membrane alanyl aminopeptidase-like [Leguminivora glycinivorella]